MLAFDNASSISPEISDALCQIASGTGFSSRKLYTNTDRVLVGGSHPILITAIANVVTRGDLADRCMVTPLTFVAPEQRRTDAELWTAFKLEQPQILGALLDAVVTGLKNMPRVRLACAPRMADFATWAVACEPSFARSGEFLAAYVAQAIEITEAVIEADSVATAVAAFMVGRDAWSGTAAGLLATLNAHDVSEAQPTKAKDWPRKASAFGTRLRRVAAPLRKIGIVGEFGRATGRDRTRRIDLRRIEIPQPAHRAADGSDTSDGSDDTTRSTAITPVRKK